MPDSVNKQDPAPRQQAEAAWHELARAIAAADNVSEQGPDHPLPPDQVGELTIIGSGIETVGFSLGDQELIRSADHVFYCVADPATVVWIRDLRPDAHDLYVLYDDNKVRYVTYMQMAEAMLHHVRQAKKVVAIYYGHPGVFVLSTHRAILIARREGHRATMRAGVSALDCLCADLGVDPSHPGLQTHEASDMLIRLRKPDTSLHVVLWQVGLIGEMGFRRKGYVNSNFSILIDYLQGVYGKDYPVTHYVASRYPTIPPLIETYPLSRLHEPDIQLRVTGISTFYLAPRDAVEADHDMLQRLGLLQPGETVKPAGSPLRDIGRYGPREMKAFKAFKNFRIPRDYRWQEDTGASRFLLRLKQDLDFQDLYRRAPGQAVAAEAFSGLSEREQYLLATRDPGGIQIAAKGAALRSDANQGFLHALLNQRPLARQVLLLAQSKIQGGKDKLVQLAGKHDLSPDMDNMRSDIDLLLREHLGAWTGVYYGDAGQLIVLIGNAGGPRRSGLFVNGVQIRPFKFQRGVLQWQAQRGNRSNGLLRFDVDQNGKRRLIGCNIWPAGQDMPKNTAFSAREPELQRPHPSQRVGRYRQASSGGTLELAVASDPQRGRYLAARLNGQVLPGALKADGNSLTVGDSRFEFGAPDSGADGLWLPQAGQLDLFGGRYIVRVAGKGQTVSHTLVLGRGEAAIDGAALTPAAAGLTAFTWSDGPAQARSGNLQVQIDPVTLLPLLFGTLQTAAGAQQQCYGMVAAGPNAVAERPEADFGLPLPAWQSLVALCSNASRTGGLLLWHKWEKAQFTAKVMNVALRRLLP
ncbi:SAM-dependent methyltransferase [Massilia sp. YIM B04103]|uniref:SAM-dependent methyltransferase n=1 Tax=Massilia sp. YIM B04103 TaxID=2963106 RepID=UPI00210DD7B4|nr:SAM-dependent methyltransferase [Massilia sp. YIM B04103]